MAETTDNFSFVTMEHQILEFWQQQNIFQKSLTQTKNGRPYLFYDGPPFATGLPHHGHLVGNILKDIVPRYFTMKGHYVERRFGWDCHGVPIEHEIDKMLGKSTSEAVAELGVGGYNQECRKIVNRYTAEWEKTVTRIGRWVDFRNDYKTMDPTFMESVWWVFRQLWDRGLIYQGTKVVPFSYALGTVLSNFEASSNYQSVQDPAITVTFPLLDEVDTYLLAWTTTPWTLPANLALCVREDIEYLLVAETATQKKYYLAQARLPSVFAKRPHVIIEQLTGRQLVGKKYRPLFSYFSAMSAQGYFQVISDNYVTTEDGTGIVHIAPAFGEDDNRVMKAHGFLQLVCPINDQGLFTNEVTDFTGMLVKDADKPIIRMLKEQNLLFDQSVIVHNYPFCPRSDTPLLYRAIPSWYVNVDKIKSDLINANQQINWVPHHIKDGRFGKWLEGARDWAISRNRYWGTPLPVWINDHSGKAVCIGSIAELEKLTKTTVTDLHRENVDQLTFQLAGEEGIYRRITEVLDCWFESGSMPYAQIHFPFEHPELLQAGLPADFVAEGLDQTRGWFYTTNILSAALFQSPAFKNVIVNGIVVAEDGKKMSKRLRNYTPPDELMENFGADALRLYLINSGLVRAEEQRFSDNGVKEMVRKALLPWYNAFKFFQTYAQVDQWSPQEHFTLGNNITDRWIISKLQTLKQNIAQEMERYQLYNVVPALFTFIEDLTNWYIRLNRRRFWDDADHSNDPTNFADKCQAYSALYLTLKELTTALAPFAPFLAEHIFQELKKLGQMPEESVHLCSYPLAGPELIDTVLELAVDRMQQVILLGRQKRNQEQIKVKIPLARLTIIHKDAKLLKEMAKLEAYLKGELNIKHVEYSTSESDYINLFARPNSPILGKRLGKEFGKFTKLIGALSAEQLVAYEEQGQLQVANELFTAGDLLIFREAKAHTQALSNRYITIDLACQLDQDLIDEGLAREIVNRIQKTRKECGFQVSDRIRIFYHGSPNLTAIFHKYRDYIASETLATHWEEQIAHPQMVSFEIDDYLFAVRLEKM